jgi:hypothetical protein
MELQSYITETNGQLPECAICHDVGTVGVEYCRKCPDLMHVACRTRLFKESGKCPGCREDWVLGKGNRCRRRVAEPVGVEEEDEEMDKEDVGEEEENIVDKDEEDKSEEEVEEEIPIKTPRKRSRK